MTVAPLPAGHGQGKATLRTRRNSGDPKGAADTKSSAPSRLLTIQDVAAHCACSSWTVRGWIDAGQLGVVRLPGRLVRVRPDVLAAFLEACR
jgi:excisionase family DNA binding protein